MQANELARKIGIRTGMLPAIKPARPEAQRIQCMEVWGGNSAVATTLEVAGLDAWVFSQPYKGDHFGGDLHYVSTCGSGRVSRFVVADVAGHGKDVGDIAVRLRQMMKKHVNLLNMASLAKELNKEFLDLSNAGRFATALLVTYFAPTDHLVLCNAGHPRPMWFRAAKRRWEKLHNETPEQIHELKEADNLPLGIIEPTNYYQFAVKLEPADMVVLYTDSLIETSAAGTDRQLGEAGLMELAQGVKADTPETFGRALLEAVAAYRGAGPIQDDQTLLVLAHNGAAPPPMTRTWGAITALAHLVGLIDY